MTHGKRTATFDPGDGLPPYRRGVMLFLFNEQGLIFCGKRNDSDPQKSDDGWQVPQGGIDWDAATQRDEPVEAAVRRELGEEIGPEVRAEIIAAYPDPLYYIFPDFIGQKAFNGKYRGQEQHAFLLRYQGGAIDIGRGADGEAPEFSHYEWRAPDDISRLIVPFKRPLYDKALGYFAPMIVRQAAVAYSL